MSDYITRHSLSEERMLISRRISRQIQSTIYGSDVPKAKIARELGITSYKLKQYINDDSEITATTLLLFCNFFNITIADFLEEAFKYDTLGHGMHVTNCIKFFKEK